MSKEKLIILLIGPLPGSVGGTTVSFQCLVKNLVKREDVEVLLVDTSAGGRGGLFKDIRRFLLTNCNILKYIRKSDVVSLHVDAARLPHLGLFVLFWSVLMRKPLIVRKFGGTSYKDYRFPLSRLGRYVARKCDLFLVQSKMLLEEARKDGLDNIQWYPTSRPLSDTHKGIIREQCRRFVYVGHVKSAKGIHELIEASKNLLPEASIDVYGPFFEGLSPDLFNNLDRINYCGILKPDTVVDTMCDYDALIYPTHHKTEGYTGAVIEAFDAGIPIVCTKWRALPELVDETNGILVEPYNVKSLSEAMNKLVEDDNLYRKLCEGMKKKRGIFDAETWSDKLVDYCKEVSKF